MGWNPFLVLAELSAINLINLDFAYELYGIVLLFRPIFDIANRFIEV